VNTLKVINDFSLDMPNAEVLSLWAQSYEIGSDRHITNTNPSIHDDDDGGQQRQLDLV
jgi:hypothetical protein